MPRTWLPTGLARRVHWFLLPLALAVCAVALQAQVWSQLPIPARPGNVVDSARGAAFADGRFVIIAGDRLYYSDDGSAWTAAIFDVAGLRDVRAGNGRFFAEAGSNIYASDNGVLWSLVGTLPDGQGSNATCQWETDGTGGVAVRNRILAGDGFIFARADVFTSADLTTWHGAGELPGTSSTTSVSVESLAYGGGRHVINYLVGAMDGSGAGVTSITAVSEDRGQTWTRAQLPGDNTALHLAYGNGFFLAVSRLGAVYRSEDGIQFRHANANLPPGWKATLSFAGGMFIRHRELAPAGLAGSVDGSFWRDLGTLPLGTTSGLAGITYGHGRFLATGMAPVAGGPAQPFLISSPQPTPPIFRSQPAGGSLAEGRRLRLETRVENPAEVSYRWMKDGRILPGTNSPAFVVNAAQAEDAGTYRCLVTNAQGTVGSDAVVVTIVHPVAAGRLINLSASLQVEGDSGRGHIGFVLAGSDPKPVTMRAIGPTLAQFQVPNPLADPAMMLTRSLAVLAANDNWHGDDGSGVGGFPLPPGSRDAVIAATLSPGVYTLVAGGADHGGGRLLAEVYDGNTSDGANRLINLSARGPIGAGGSLVAGFVIGGNTTLPVVIRGIGPALASHGVTDALPNPQLRLFRGHDKIAANDNWLDDDGSTVGAFPLPVGSPDAVLALTLPPGVYTVELTSAIPGGAGTALVEIYDAL